MWSFFRSFFEPTPQPVTIIGARFPADGSTPYLLPLTTTSTGVHNGPDCFLFHVPDLRTFWKTPRAWEWRDLDQTILENQPNKNCNGVYMKFFSFCLDDLPENRSVPTCFCRVNALAAGDVFIVKLAPQECDEHGWAVYEDIPADFLELPCITRVGATSFRRDSLSTCAWCALAHSRSEFGDRRLQDIRYQHAHHRIRHDEEACVTDRWLCALNSDVD
jgi:hypothetical protein